MRCDAKHDNCKVFYQGPWKTKKGKWGVKNKNKVLKYFDSKRKAYLFRHTATGKPRDYSAERYERRRQKFFADFKKDPKSTGHLGNIFPDLFPLVVLGPLTHN